MLTDCCHMLKTCAPSLHTNKSKIDLNESKWALISKVPFHPTLGSSLIWKNGWKAVLCQNLPYISWLLFITMSCFSHSLLSMVMRSAIQRFFKPKVFISMIGSTCAVTRKVTSAIGLGTLCRIQSVLQNFPWRNLIFFVFSKLIMSAKLPPIRFFNVCCIFPIYILSQIINVLW